MTSYSVVPLLAADFKTGGLALSMTQAMALPGVFELLVMIIVNLFAERFMGRFGWKPQFIAGMTILVASSLIAYFSPDLVWFLFSRLISGIGVGLSYNSSKMMSLLEDDKDARLSIQAERNAGKNGGSIIGAFLGTLLYGYGFGIRVMLVASMISVAAVVFAALFMKNDKTHEEKVARKTGTLSGFFKAVSGRDAFAFLLLLLIPGTILSGSAGYIMSVFVREQGLAPETIGRIIMINGLIVTWFGAMLTKMATSKWGVKFSIIAGNIILFGAIGLFAWQYNAAAAYITAALSGIAIAFLAQSSLEFFINTKAGKTLGYQAMGGYFNIIMYIAAALGTLILGWLFKYGVQWGLGVVLMFSSGLLVVYCLISALMKKRPSE